MRHITDHQIPAWRLYLVIIIKNKNFDFPSMVCLDGKIRSKASEKRDKYLYFARKLRNLSNTRVTVVLVVIGTVGTDPNCFDRVGNQRKNQDYLDYSIVDIC